MNLRPSDEMAPLIQAGARRLEILDNSMLLVTCCAAAEVLRRRGLKTGVLVKALIDAAVKEELEHGLPPPRFPFWRRTW